MKEGNEKHCQEEVDPEFDHFITLTARLLEDLIEQEGVECESMFNSSLPSGISLVDFLRRVHKFTQFSKECLLIAIIYLDRYNLTDEDFSLNSTNVHKILLTCLLLATKFQDDRYYDNKTFEFAGGVNVAQLHRYETHVFEALDFNLFVDEESYNELRQKLQDAYLSETAEQEDD